jgi:hypothetical protein
MLLIRNLAHHIPYDRLRRVDVGEHSPNKRHFSFTESHPQNVR